MDSHCGLSQQVLVDELKLRNFELLAFEVASKTVHNICLLLLHALNKQEDVEAYFEDGPHGADVVVTEAEVCKAKLRHLTLRVLAPVLYAEVVDLD